MEKIDPIASWLALDRRPLFAEIVEQLDLEDGVDYGKLWMDELKSHSGLNHSFLIGSWLSPRIKIVDEAWRFLAAHPNNVVREWAAIIVGMTHNITFARKLAWIKPFVDDASPGLREVAWMALRADVIQDPLSAILCLVPWTGSRNERLRRFAAEVTRPCGKWCSHVQLLKVQPELGLSILEPLSADDSQDVQNSVCNWLNDASKTRPDWAKATAERWLIESTSAKTQ